MVQFVVKEMAPHDPTATPLLHLSLFLQFRRLNADNETRNVGDLFMTTNSCVKSFVQEWCGYIFGGLCFLCCDFWRTQCTVAARMVARLVGHMVDAIVAMQQATFSCRNWPKKAHHYNSHDRVQSMSRSRQC
jgi:hypothetical protein